MLVGELECLDDTDGLLDRASNREVVHVRGAQGALGVDEEGAAESNAFLLKKHAVCLGDGVVLVGKEAEREVGAETALLARSVGPCEMRVLRVGGYTNDLSVDGLELLKGVVEGEDLSGADELLLAVA